MTQTAASTLTGVSHSNIRRTSPSCLSTELSSKGIIIYGLVSSRISSRTMVNGSGESRHQFFTSLVGRKVEPSGGGKCCASTQDSSMKNSGKRLRQINTGDWLACHTALATKQIPLCRKHNFCLIVQSKGYNLEPEMY